MRYPGFSYVCLYPDENSKQKEEYAAALKKEQDEVAKLKAELEGLKEKHKEEIKTFSEEQIRQEDEAKTLRELVDKAETGATSARQELQTLQGRIKVWLFEFNKIQAFMSGKLSLVLAPLFDVSSRRS